MGGAGHLPQPERVAVVLTGAVRPEHARDVGLRLHVHHRRVDVGAEDARRAAERTGDVGGLARPDDRQPDSGAAVDEEAVERLRERLHAVVVRGHGERRLGLAGGDDALRLQPVQPVAGAHRPRDLGVDVEGEAVAGVLERAVPDWVDRLQALPRILRPRQVDRDGDRSTLDADDLGGHPHPDVTAADELLVRRRPLRVGVDAPAHVHPLDDGGPAELRRVLGPAYQHPRGVGRGLVLGELPAAVGGALALLGVRRGFARGLVLVLHVAVLLQVHGDGRADVDALAALEPRELRLRSTAAALRARHRRGAHDRERPGREHHRAERGRRPQDRSLHGPVPSRARVSRPACTRGAAGRARAG